MKKQLRIAIASLCLFAAPLVASSVSPNFTTTTVQAMNIYQDPTGFADLHWGETLEAVQQTHKAKFARYMNGTASYHIYIPDAHGSVYFSGPVTLCGIFNENKLFGIVIPFSRELLSARIEGLTKMWGTPKRYKDVYIWEGPFSLVLVNDGPKAATVSIVQRPNKAKS